MGWKKLNDFFFFTKREQLVLLLLVIILFIGVGIRVFRNSVGVQTTMDAATFFEGTQPWDPPQLTLERAANTVRDSLNDQSILPININAASKEELIRLPHIGAKTAQKIIEYRLTAGTFKVKKDIIKVKGIGLKMYKKLEPLISISDD